ncbi:hypothetical protein WMF37_31400 [Sorangium sp. So ce291]
MSRAPLTILVLAGAALWALFLIGHGWPVPLSFFAPLSAVVSGLSALLLLWDAWLWRLGLLHPWPLSQPVLRGTWRGELTPAEGEPLPIFLVVEQTFSTVTTRTFTAESRSASIAARLDEVDGDFLLAAIYRNEPDHVAHVRRPPLQQEPLDRLHLGRPRVEGRAPPLAQRLEHGEDVLRPLAQRREIDPDEEPRQEVAAERAPLHHRLQGPVRGGDQRHLHPDRTVLAHREDLAVLEQTQDLRLRSSMPSGADSASVRAPAPASLLRLAIVDRRGSLAWYGLAGTSTIIRKGAAVRGARE